MIKLLGGRSTDVLARARPLEDSFEFPAISCSTIVSKDFKVIIINPTSSMLNDCWDVGSLTAVWTLSKWLDASYSLRKGEKPLSRFLAENG